MPDEAIRGWPKKNKSWRTCRRSECFDGNINIGDGYRHRRPVEHDALLDSADYGCHSNASGAPGEVQNCVGTLAVINQRPHDLFFFGRPQEMLAGNIELPGCWLDASAVIVRQYLAYCFDSSVKDNVVDAFPATGKQLQILIVAKGQSVRFWPGWLNV